MQNLSREHQIDEPILETPILDVATVDSHVVDAELNADSIKSMDLIDEILILNKTVDPSTRDVWVKQELTRLSHELSDELAVETDIKKKFQLLLTVFYQKWQFSGDQESYFSSSNAFIDQVVERRKGIPVSLGVLLLYFGRQFDFPIEGVAFPTQFLLKLTWPGDEPLYLNPYDGQYVERHLLQAWLIGFDGPLAIVKKEHLASVDDQTIIERWLTLLKSIFLREEQYTLALKCSDLALNLTPNDPYEIRDRGFIYQQLDCVQVAIADFKYFIEQRPNDPVAKILQQQVKRMNKENVILH